MAEYFKDIPKIKYEGVNSTNPLSFKYYNPDEVVMGKTMREQLQVRSFMVAHNGRRWH